MRRFFIKVQNAIALREQHEDKGATMVEYGLMVTLIAVVCAVVVGTIGSTLATKFGLVVSAL